MKSLFSYFDGSLKSPKLKRTLSTRLRILLKKFNQEEPWASLPEGQLIVIADALIEFFEGEIYAVYFILVRGINDTQAFILPPCMYEGGETVAGWQKAFSQIPTEVFDRMRVLVCDGHGGLICIAKRYSLILQRCHFHLLSRIAHNASFGPLNKTHGLGTRVKNLVEVVLYDRDPRAIELALDALLGIKKTITSRNFKTVVSGFLRHFDDYRTYLNFPQYRLPTTSNSAEFLNSRIRDLQYRARGFRTPKSLFAWINGLCQVQKSSHLQRQISTKLIDLSRPGTKFTSFSRSNKPF